MPELPDILLYLHALRPRVVGQRVSGVRLVSAFLLRSIDPPLASVEGRIVTDLHRLGKRVVFELERELCRARLASWLSTSTLERSS